MYMKRGDWACPQCGQNNFASRDKCYGCGCFRSKAFKTDQSARPGDWNCSCGELNFASRNACRKCGNVKPGSVTLPLRQKDELSRPLAGSTRPGDWTCTCGELNFASRSNCRKCGILKGGTSTTTPAPLTDTDTCIICMDRKKDTVITVCGHLGYCGVCALNLTQCPICRKGYNPDTQLLKIYDV